MCEMRYVKSCIIFEEELLYTYLFYFSVQPTRVMTCPCHKGAPWRVTVGTPVSPGCVRTCVLVTDSLVTTRQTGWDNSWCVGPRVPGLL